MTGGQRGRSKMSARGCRRWPVARSPYLAAGLIHEGQSMRGTYYRNILEALEGDLEPDYSKTNKDMRFTWSKYRVVGARCLAVLP